MQIEEARGLRAELESALSPRCPPTNHPPTNHSNATATSFPCQITWIFIKNDENNVAADAEEGSPLSGNCSRPPISSRSPFPSQLFNARTPAQPDDTDEDYDNDYDKKDFDDDNDDGDEGVDDHDHDCGGNNLHAGNCDLNDVKIAKGF